MLKQFKIVVSLIVITLVFGCSEREINTKAFLSIEKRNLDVDEEFKFIFLLHSEKSLTLRIHDNLSEVLQVSSRNNVCKQSSFILAKRNSAVIEKRVLSQQPLKLEVNGILKFDKKNNRFELILEKIGKMCFEEGQTKIDLSFKLFESLDRMIELSHDDGIYLGHFSLELPSEREIDR